MKRLKEGGFTLIEIAIAIVVIALLLGSLLGPLSVRIEQADRQKTQELLDEIKEALYGFAARTDDCLARIRTIATTGQRILTRAVPGPA